MDLNVYKQCVEFRKLDKKYWTDECVICYLQIIPSNNIGFACNHNSCIMCYTEYLKFMMKKKDIPCCFVCRNIICYMDVDDISSQKTIMNIINPPTDLVVYRVPSDIEEINSQYIYAEDPRLYHPILLYNRDCKIIYAISQCCFFSLILYAGYYLLFL